MEMVEEAGHGKARNVAGFLKARELCFFQSSEDGMVVKKGGGGIAAELGQTEDAHYAKLIMRMRLRVVERQEFPRARNYLPR